ncbi:zinc-binding dehydrogenase [Pendulispora rubella]|uniref:Zinc-binding dehydrogenase n=1 Tax=Pendulispora rubella TaxID=2741070 RepID=A0ABZ2LAN1_9BACT
MKAWIVTSGMPWRLQVRDVPSPSPMAHEALISVVAFSINRGEMELLSWLPEAWIPGLDVAGIVLEPAADGSGPPRGARVLGLVDQGSWAERVAVPTSALALIPAGVSLMQAATLPAAGLCAMGTLRLAECTKRSRVLVTGAAGGVGSFQVQMAARAGAHVVAVTARRDANAWLHRLGATDVVSAIAKARGLFDMILESVGGVSLEEAVGKIAPGGTIVLSGNSSAERTSMSVFDFTGHEGARLVTFMNYASDEHTGERLQRLAASVDRGEIVPQIGHVGSWDELDGALQALRSRSVQGKAVLFIPFGDASNGPRNTAATDGVQSIAKR